MEKVVYLDHASTTPVHPKVLEAMLPYFSQKFGNPSSVHSVGQEAHEGLDQARRTVTGVLRCASAEVVFTSGATESIDSAIKGIAFANQGQGNHIVTTPIEHKAVLSTCSFLKKFGFETTYVKVDEYGVVDPASLEKAVTDKTTLVSINMANNEIGTIQPLAELVSIVRERSRRLGHKIYFHTDAVQAAAWMDLNVEKLGVDLLNISGHKIFGPKGVGVLYLRKGTSYMPQSQGGGQERNLRGGTENVPGIVGLAAALDLARNNREENVKRCRELRDRLISGIQGRISNVLLSGHPVNRLPNHASFCFQHIEGEAILLHLDFVNIAASSGSACASGSVEPSHVLTAVGLPPETAHGSIRFTLGPENTVEEIDRVLTVLPGIVDKLRAISPLASDQKTARSK